MVNGSDLIEELRTIAERLGGTIERIDGYKSEGRQSKKVVIEYDIRNKES